MKSKVHSLKGRKQTPEQIRKRVEATKKNREMWSEEKINNWKAAISRNNKSGTEEVKRKNSESHKGKVVWNKGKTAGEDPRVLSGKSHHQYGKPMGDNVKKALRKSNLGKKQSLEIIEKRIAPLRGVERSEEVKERIRKTNIETWSRPEIRMKSSGENSASWLGGKSFEEYPEEFRNIKEYIRDRDNRTCQMCGISENENGSALCVHHINYDKRDCSEENLISLCIKNGCHPKTNYNRKYWVRYFQNLIKEEYKLTI